MKNRQNNEMEKNRTPQKKSVTKKKFKHEQNLKL